MSWRGTDFAENEAKQRAADANVMLDQYGERDQRERREVNPPIAVESAMWSHAGELDYWIRERFGGGAGYADQTVVRSGSSC